jgi:predicted phosphodiesterase
MKLGVTSDTHDDRANAFPHIIKELKARGVEAIIHCGDIIADHINPELFGNLPVFCALVRGQKEKPEFDNLLKNPPAGWTFTLPGIPGIPGEERSRIITVGDTKCYAGHQRSFDFLFSAETAFSKTLDSLRKDFDGLRWVFAGHSHQQTFFKTLLVTYVNPGAVEGSFSGYEFATVDTDTGEVVFCRIPETNSIETTFSVGIISDTLNISKRDTGYWKKQRKEFESRGVTHVIHCGNIALEDIGHPEFTNFTVYYKLRKTRQIQIYQGQPPANWHEIPDAEPIVAINDRQFYVHSDLARILLEESGAEMHRECLKILEAYPEVGFILYSGSDNAFLQEDQRAIIINPGNARTSRSFIVLCSPRDEMTIGYVPTSPLPPIE